MSSTRIRHLGVVSAALAIGVITASLNVPAAQADDRRCTGRILAKSVDGDVVVPRGATCRLVGTRVDGNVKVYRGATLIARGVRVGGNIQAENHRRVEILVRTVDDRTVRARIDGSIQLKQGGGGEIRRTITGSDIQLFSNRGRFSVTRNFVEGNLQCKSNDPRPRGFGNVVQGNKEDQCRGF
jgi:hypothetical protein